MLRAGSILGTLVVAGLTLQTIATPGLAQEALSR